MECGLDREMYLFFGTKTIEETIFHDVLSGISGSFSNLHYFPVIESPPAGFQGLRGLITGELIRSSLPDVNEKTFYLCGPKAMYDFCIPELEGLGIPMRKIRKEVYGPPMDITRSPNWPGEVKVDQPFRVSIKGGGSVEVRAGESLAASLEKQGILVPTLCRSGRSQCRVKILSGKVFEPAGVPVRRSDRRYGYVHACVSYPLENLEIMI